MPEGHGVGAGQADGAGGVAVVQGAGEGDDADLRTGELRVRGDGDSLADQGEFSHHQASTTSTLTTSSMTGLDSRVSAAVAGLGQDLLGHLAVDREFEPLALADSAERGEAQPGQCTDDGLALRVENLGLGHDVDNDPGHPATPVRERWVRAQRRVPSHADPLCVEDCLVNTA